MAKIHSQKFLQPSLDPVDFRDLMVTSLFKDTCGEFSRRYNQ